MTRGRSGCTVTKLMSPEVGKWVTVNVNGNTHHEARVLISPYTMRQFESLLSHLTDKLKPPFGAVWRLFTEAGVEVKDLDDIKGGHTYIASGRARPMFPVRLKSGRCRRDGAERGLRSHSAVGSLDSGRGVGGHLGHTGAGGGGERGVGGVRAAGGRGPARALDAASDTNVKQSPTSPAAHQPRASRPAPAPRRTNKTRTRAAEQNEPADQVWDQPLHKQQQNYYQQPLTSAKQKQSTNKGHIEEIDGDDNTGELEGISIKSPIRYANHTVKTTTEGRIPPQTRLKL